MSPRLLPAVLLIALLLVSLDFCLVVAFTPVSGPTCRKVSHGSLIWAKPPPISTVDLEAIESFEATMDLEVYGDDDSEDLLPEEDDDFSLELSSGDDVREFIVPPELHNKRIDAAVSALIGSSLSRSACGNLVADGSVKLVQEGKSSLLDRKSHKIAAGTKLRVAMPKEEKPLEIVEQDLPLDIIYEDEHMIILNKAAGMVVHPAAGNWDGTVVNALAYYLANHSPHGAGDFVGNDGSAVLTATIDDPAGADGEAVSFRPGIVVRLVLLLCAIYVLYFPSFASSIG